MKYFLIIAQSNKKQIERLQIERQLICVQNADARVEAKRSSIKCDIAYKNIQYYIAGSSKLR